MRLNKYIAHATGISRREADDLVYHGKVMVNGRVAELGTPIEDSDKVIVNGKAIALPTKCTMLMLNKPVGYICSRNAQAKGAKTVYELLPEQYRPLKTIGRLDRDSSGLILLTDDGDLAFELTHPKFYKTKVYRIRLDKSLDPLHQQMISDFGVTLPDGPSKLTLECLSDDRRDYQVTMHEGRNRQIRRTFASLGYTVINLHRLSFGAYSLGSLKPGEFKVL